MYRTSIKLVAGILLSAALAGAASAQGTMEQQNACRGDVFRLCASYIPDVNQIVACLRGNEAYLSEACHDVMVEQQPAPASTQQYPTSPRLRAGYHLLQLEKDGRSWRISARARGPLPESREIGEQREIDL